jgi:glycosyltransferase involved in cell wall biosynthesis
LIVRRRDRKSFRLLHVIPSYAPAFSFGGPPESTHRLCKALGDAGVEVRVLTTNAASPRDRMPRIADAWTAYEGVFVKYCRAARRAVWSREFAASVFREVRAADIVHITAVFNFTTPLAIAACVAAGKPFVLSPRGSLDPWSISNKRWKKSPALLALRPLLNRATAVHATSATEASSIGPIGIRSPAVVVSNGVDFEAAASTSRERDVWRARLRVSSDEALVVMLGRVHQKKGIDIALPALRQVLNAGRRVVLALVGPDEEGYGGEVERLIDVHGVRSAVRRAGLVTGAEKYQLLAEADLLLLPSRQENFGNVVVEALAAGSPVAASRATPWEMLEQEGCGRWVDLSPEAFAAATLEELAIPNTRTQEDRRRRLASRFAWPTIARAMKAVYEACLEHRRPLPFEFAASAPRAGAMA